MSIGRTAPHYKILVHHLEKPKINERVWGIQANQSASTRICPRPLRMRSSRPPEPPKTFFCSWLRNPPIPFDFSRTRSSASSSAFSLSSSSVRCSRRSCVSVDAFEVIAARRAARSVELSAGREGGARGGGGGGLIRVRLGGGGAGSTRRGLRLLLRILFLLS